MAITVEAVYENGVFRPLAPVDLREGAKVFVAPAETPSAVSTPPTVRDILAREHSRFRLPA